MDWIGLELAAAFHHFMWNWNHASECLSLAGNHGNKATMVACLREQSVEVSTVHVPKRRQNVHTQKWNSCTKGSYLSAQNNGSYCMVAHCQLPQHKHQGLKKQNKGSYFFTQNKSSHCTKLGCFHTFLALPSSACGSVICKGAKVTGVLRFCGSYLCAHERQ